VTLAQRLLIAIGVLTIATTAALGFGVREAWRRTEEERFREQRLVALDRLQLEVARQVNDLSELLGPLCRHDQMVDSALVGLASGDLHERRVSLSVRVPELRRALGLAELLLVTNEGEILGAGHADGLVGKRDPALAARMRDPSGRARLRTRDPPLAIEAHCVRHDQRNPKRWVGLYGARHLDPVLEQVAESHGFTLSFTRPDRHEREMIAEMKLRELEGLTLYVTQSRMPLLRALNRLDSAVLAIGGGTFAAALLLAMLLARGLARPIVSMARQAREVVGGEPKPVVGRGGKELEQFAQAYNQAIADLVALRKRLAATERIAARREIARRVAHEIKNPLAPIRAAVETLRRLRARDDPAFDEYFDEATRTVLEEVARISNIVTEFTRFARLPPPNPALMELVDTVKKVVGLHATGSTRIELRATPCPPIQADRDQVVQVVTNLLQNAIDAASAGAEPRVVVEVGPQGREHVAIVVSDNGPGVSPEMRDRLFEPYATTKQQGTGLGLAIVQRIVVEHGGEIRHDDAPGGGARFTVSLPVSGPTLLPESPVSIPSSR
jgi:two-component system, NtrC family, nitrogen regulation sensor histidine kinase NtrY